MSEAAAENRHEQAAVGGERIIQTLELHGPREIDALQMYEALVESSDDAGISLLASAIIDDERRHHMLMTQMLAMARATLRPEEADADVPRLTHRTDPALRAAIDRLLELEREDADELRLLQRELRSIPESSMLPLLVEMMYLDTAKHIEILKVLRHHVTAS